MKTKNLLKLFLSITLSVFICSNALADNISIKTPELNGKIIFKAQNFKLTDWQAVMSCHFDYKGSRKGVQRFIQTFVQPEAENNYLIRIKKGSLSEFLPGWDLLTCAYKLILIGRDTVTNKSLFGEIYLLGKEHGQMEMEDIRDFENIDYVTKALGDKLNDLKLHAFEGQIFAD